MKSICEFFEISRSWYYEKISSQAERTAYESRIVAKVKAVRKEMSFYGVRKLWHELNRQDIKIGRDKLYKILRKHDLTLPPKYKRIKTSILGNLPYSGNLIKDMALTHKHQVIVTDITFISTTEGPLYLSAIMDLYSRKILSYHISNNLKTEGSITCLDSALKLMDDTDGVIHHSDHGSQYCSYKYIKKLLLHHMLISFTGNNHCYDNAKMERFFNTLKHEYGLKGVIKTKYIAKKLIVSAIHSYNTLRLHAALGYHTPDEVYYAA